MKLLAISLVHHDSNMCYFDGYTLKYHKLERTKQIKRYSDFNMYAWVEEIQIVWGICPSEIDEIIFDLDPSRFPSLIKDFNVQSVLSGYNTAIELTNNPFSTITTAKCWYISHHFAHALSTWPVTDQTPAVHIVIDGIGDGKPWSVFKNGCLSIAGSILNGSIGWGMREAGKQLNINYKHYNDIAGKVMGLQSYGKIDNEYFEILKQYDMNHINKIFSFSSWIEYKQDSLLANHTMLDWIHTVHQYVGTLLINFFSSHANQSDIISYSGGVAQNVIWNSMLKERFPNLIIPPHSSDEGTSLGSIEWLRVHHNLPQFVLENFPYCQQDESPIDQPSDETIQKVAKLLADGEIVGWYQGNGEVGPRALGNRSILMNPCIINAKELVNNIKKRENYRPFGCSVLAEYAADFFESSLIDEYMLYTARVNSCKFPAITHVDGTCRIQTVTNKNKTFHKLLVEFYKLTGYPILLNTSLNIAGNPLAGFPDNAIAVFETTTIDAMIIGNTIYSKTI